MRCFDGTDAPVNLIFFQLINAAPFYDELFGHIWTGVRQLQYDQTGKQLLLDAFFDGLLFAVAIDSGFAVLVNEKNLSVQS